MFNSPGTPLHPNDIRQGAAIAIKPAAGPLIVSSELLMNVVTIPPMMAVNTPPMGGYP